MRQPLAFCRQRCFRREQAVNKSIFLSERDPAGREQVPAAPIDHYRSHGLMVGQVSLLGQYQFQLTDAHGHVVHGMTLRQPFTIRYHYITAMLASLGTEQAAESFSYDGDLRPSEDTAIWGNGSGQSGQFFDETRSYD